jgi:capsular exopolysaccharide synthesis family protein
MSRVFEALEKASKERAAPRIEPPPPVNRQTTPEPATHKPPQPGTNGNGTARASRNGKSWRETAEEMLFGRDLRNYRSYPLVATEAASPAAEQYKILREQVKRLRGQANARVISVTSPIKRDGKSIVAANLAAALALDYNERVLLIDCDLRHPQAHQYFGLQLTPGLSEYLTSGANGDILKYVQQTSLPSLQVLPAGKSVSVAAELLAMDKMQHTLAELRTKFPNHQIIIDNPPVLSTADPLILAAQVDGIIMVVRAGKTPRDCLMEALETLKSDKIMGVVFNGADLGVSSKYYYY